MPADDRSASSAYAGMPTPARYVAMTATILGISLTVLDATIVNLALPGIALDLHASAPHAIWIVTAYQLAILALRLPLAMLGDLVGYRLGLGALALLSAHPTGFDIAWRMMVCGIGFGLFQSPNNHTIVTSAPPRRSGGASGMLGTARLTGQTLGAVMLASLFSLEGATSDKGPVIGLGVAAGLAALASAFSSMRLRTSR